MKGVGQQGKEVRIREAHDRHQTLRWQTLTFSSCEPNAVEVGENPVLITADAAGSTHELGPISPSLQLASGVMVAPGSLQFAEWNRSYYIRTSAKVGKLCRTSTPFLRILGELGLDFSWSCLLPKVGVCVMAVH